MSLLAHSSTDPFQKVITSKDPLALKLMQSRSSAETIAFV